MKSIIVWDDNLAQSGNYPSIVKGWSAAQGRALDKTVFDDRISLKDPAEVSVLVYTSGTTGPPKVNITQIENKLICL